MSNVELFYQRFLDYLRAYSSKKDLPFVDVLTAIFPQDEHAPFAAAAHRNNSPDAEKYLIQHFRAPFYELAAEGLLDDQAAAVEALADKRVKEERTRISTTGGNGKAAKLDGPKKSIQDIWASGKYTNRNLCAEEEYVGLGFNSFKTARNALTGTPDPNPWPAKKAKKK